MSLDEILNVYRDEILEIARIHGAQNLRVFGSVVRGEARSDSDVDFVIDVPGPTSPWFPGGLVADLEQLLGHRVDIVESDALREPLRKYVLDEAVTL